MTGCPMVVRCVPGLPLCDACEELGAAPELDDDTGDRWDFAAEYARLDEEEDL